MGRRKYAVLCLTALFLGLFPACGTFIERTHLDITPHVVEPLPGLTSGDYIAVSSQAELEQAIWNMVLGRVESAIFRLQYFDSYSVDDAVLEIRSRPLTAYAVNMVTHQILSEWHGVTEMELSISYHRTAEQIAGVLAVNTASRATTILGQMLREGETYLAMRSPANIANESFLESILRDYYYGQALEVVILPQWEINLYSGSGPDAGGQRIAEVILDFGFDRDTLIHMRNDLHLAAAELIYEMPEGLSSPQAIIWLAETLSERVFPILDAEAGMEFESEALPPIYRTAYGALVLGQASSEGIAMAFQALLELFGFSAQVVLGERADLPHVWNILSFDGNYYHMDVSMLHSLEAAAVLFVPDEVMIFYGYRWDGVQYPSADSPLRFDDFAR